VGLPALGASVTSQTNPSALLPLYSGSDVGFEVCERAELGGDDGAEGLCALGVERLVG
jgi:hypothetical protein